MVDLSEMTAGRYKNLLLDCHALPSSIASGLTFVPMHCHSYRTGTPSQAIAFALLPLQSNGTAAGLPLLLTLHSIPFHCTTAGLQNITALPCLLS